MILSEDDKGTRVYSGKDGYFEAVMSDSADPQISELTLEEALEAWEAASDARKEVPFADAFPEI